MGHLINPISLRLSVNSFWNSNWVLSNNFNFINVFKKDYSLLYFLNWLLQKSKFVDFNLLLSHFKLYRINNYVYINLYNYNANQEEFNYKYHVLQIRNILLNKLNNRNKEYSVIQYNYIYKFIYKSLLFNIYWILVLSRFNIYFQKVNKNIKFYFNIFSLDFNDITVESITKYISLRLQKKFSLDWVLFPILKDLNSKVKYKHIAGFKILCSGRFTRKQIATYSWKKNGSLQLNTISDLIRYSEAKVRLKYGLCGIKLWISYGNNNSLLTKRDLSLVYPNYLPFKYHINKKVNNIQLFLNYWYFLYLRINFFKMFNIKFYKLFLKIKLKILLETLINKLENKTKNSVYAYKYKLDILSFDKIIIFTKEVTFSSSMINLAKKI